MNTTEIIYEIARRSKESHIRLSRKEVAHVVNLFLAVLKEELAKPTGEVRLQSFGIFSVQERKYTGGILKIGDGKFTRPSKKETSYYSIKFRLSRIMSRRLPDRA